MSRSAAEKEAVYKHELSTWREAWKTILLKFQTPSKRRKSETIRLFCARHSVLWPQTSSDRWRLRKYLATSCLADLRFVKIVHMHGKDYNQSCSSCALCALCRQANPAQPQTLLSSPGHKEGAGAGSTSSFAVPLTTNDMEKSSSAGICNHDWLAIQRRLQPQINAQVRQATFWDTHKRLCSGELRRATDRFALVDQEIIEVVHDQAGEVQFSGDNGVVDTVQDEADK